MDEKKHSIDKIQFDQILELIKPPKRNVVSLEAILKLAQVLAFFIGGAWVFFKFLDHDRETAQIGLKRDRIALQQAEISLDTLQRRAELSDIEYEQSVALKELEIERLRLQNRLDEVEIDSSTGRIIDYSYHLKVGEGKIKSFGDLATYSGEFRVEITNKSEENLTVDSIVIDTFRFSGDKGQSSKTETNITPIGSIPKFHLVDSKFNQGETVDGWEFLGREVFLRSFSPGVVNFLSSSGIDLSIANQTGSMLGVWRPGETTFFRKDYIIQGTPGDYIGFVAIICFNECRDSGVWNFPSTKILPLVQASSELGSDDSRSLETAD